MTRNGLLILIAMLMAFALPLRFENNAQAQVWYDFRLDGSIIPDWRNLGSVITINVGPDGTIITGHPLLPPTTPSGIGRPTFDRPGTVFMNIGGPSQINAGGAGAVINSTGVDAFIGLDVPAIINGLNTMSIEETFRIYQIRVSVDPVTELWMIEYGFYYLTDPARTFYPVTFDELPPNIQDYEIFPDMPIWTDTPPPNLAILPPGLSLLGLALAPGESIILPNTGFIVIGDPIFDDDGIPIFPSMIPPGIYDPDVLPPLDVPSGVFTPGTLTINVRNAQNPMQRRFEGDDRTLIQSPGGTFGVIRNHGTLTVNDARIRAAGSGYILFDDEFFFFGGYGVGIYHSFSRGWILNDDLDEVIGYAPSMFLESLILNNTQIGEPGGIRLIPIFDPLTGMPVLDPITGEQAVIEVGGNGIAVDQNGRPRQIATHISAGDTIMSEGVNGRIVAGQNISLRRSPVGSVLRYPGWAEGTFVEAQGTFYNINNIVGPSIGIHALAHSFNTLRQDNVYFNARYYVNMWFPGDMDRSFVSPLRNQIQLNDNSWIFANTGISFGNVEFFPGDGAIRIHIDRTSGIYSPGDGFLSPMTPVGVLYFDGIGMTGFVGGSAGITDRYSLTQLIAVDAATIYILPYAVYSGSFHEIQVDGKILTGAPSRAGIQFTFADLSGMSPTDRAKLYGVYYYDPSDPDADRWGRVYFTVETAHKFIAYNTQPSRVFWIRIDGRDPEPLTYFDYATQRWIVHPNASSVRINTGIYASRDPLPVFTAFDVSSGIGIDIVGTSMAWEGTVLPGVAPWSTYYGPTVRLITALGDDALIAGGSAHNMTGAAMSFADLSHVAKVVIGENNDVRNLSRMLFVGTSDAETPGFMTNFRQSVSNFQAFDQMTSAKRARFLYDPNLLYIDELFDDLRPNGQGDFESNRFHFDNAGVHGDIITAYSPVAYIFGGGGVLADGTEWETTLLSNLHPFWAHFHPGLVWYTEEILEFGESSGLDLGEISEAWALVLAQHALVPITVLEQNPSYLLGHRDLIPPGDAGQTAEEIPGRSLILNEVLLNFLAGNQPGGGTAEGTFGHSYGYADSPRHFREALARLLHVGSTFHTGLSPAELMAGYTRDGTLIVFTNGDIFSGNIFGGGLGDDYRARILGAGGGVYTLPVFNYGNIDLRFVDGVTLFNRNVLEVVSSSNIFRAPGIRVRDVYIERTGHLILNDAEFAVNPFAPLTTGSIDYASRLLVHDVLNEGIVSGNGVFQIGQRWSFEQGVDYFEGLFINRGILAPGLPGFIGENEHQARLLELTAYENMLNTVSDSSGDALWRQLIRGVPGGQYGIITIFGGLRLADEQWRAVYDPTNPLFNTQELLRAGEYHVTIGNDTIRDMFGKYAAIIANATPTFDPVTRTYDRSVLAPGENSREEWRVIATEKLGTHLSWFSPSAFIDTRTGLPILTPYEQFEYMLDPSRWTQLDHLLMRFGFSDVVSVHGTIPPYWYARDGWGTALHNQGNRHTAGMSLLGHQHLGITHLGGVIQADRIYDTDPNADSKERLTSFIILASDGYTGDIKRVTSATNNWVFANVDTLPFRMASGQIPAVLTVVDDPNYYLNRISGVGDSYNARAIASTLDSAMVNPNPGLALAFQFGLNSPETLHNVFRQVASSTRANSIVMNLTSPSDHLFNHIGYGSGGLSTGNRGNVVFRNAQTGQLQQPFGQPAVPPPGQQFAPPMAGQTRGQSPFFRTGSVWGAYTHSNFVMGDDDNSFRYTFHRNGVMIGNEWNLTPSSVLGGVFTVNEGALRSLDDRTKSTDYTFGLYFVAAPFEQFELKSYLGGGYQTYRMNRYIRNNDIFIANSLNNQHNLFGINDHYNAETRGHSFNWAIEFARPFTVNPNFVIRPTAGFEFQSIQQNAYTDRKGMGVPVSWSMGNSANMAVGEGENPITGPSSGTFGMDYRKMTFSRSLARFGVNTESYFPRGGWRFRTYYVHRVAGDRRPVSEQSFSSGSRTFNVRGADLGTAYCQVGLGTHFWLNRDRTATLFMNGDWNFSMLNRGYSMLHLMIGLQQNF